MGLQDVLDVTLIRHAYVRTSKRRLGLGSRLLGHLQALTQRRVLIGTGADASWAIHFYEKHGFRVVPAAEKYQILQILEDSRTTGRNILSAFVGRALTLRAFGKGSRAYCVIVRKTKAQEL